MISWPSVDGPFTGGSYSGIGNVYSGKANNELRLYNASTFYPDTSAGYSYERVKSPLFNPGTFGSGDSFTLDFTMRASDWPVLASPMDSKSGQTGIVINVRFAQSNKELYFAISHNGGSLILSCYEGNRTPLSHNNLTQKSVFLLGGNSAENRYHRYTIQYDKNTIGDKVKFFLDGEYKTSFPDVTSRTTDILNKDFIYISPVNRNILDSRIDVFLNYVKLYGAALTPQELSSYSASLLSIEDPEIDMGLYDEATKDYLCGMEYLDNHASVVSSTGLTTSELLSTIQDSNVFLLSCHGSHESSLLQDYTCIYTNPNAQGNRFTKTQDVLDLPEGYFHDTKLVVLTGCETAAGNNSIVKAFVERGVDCAGGFTVLSYAVNHKRFSAHLFEEFAQGRAAEQALEKTKIYMRVKHGFEIGDWPDSFIWEGDTSVQLIS